MEMALDYSIFHFSVLAVPLTQTFTNITTTYRVPTKVLYKYICKIMVKALELTNQNKC